MSKRKDIITERATRAPGEGPQRAKRPLMIEDVDRLRKLGCARYDECLGEMAIVGCRGWTCPISCLWYRAAGREEVPYREGEAYYTTGDTPTGPAVGDEP